MDSLTKYLVEQIKGKTIAVYGGGFKPPTKGHFGVVKQALEQNPSITEFRVYVGTGERDGITQSQSVLIWEIYSKYLPFKVDIVPSKVAPIKAIYDTAKENPQDEVLWVIGAREGNEEDFSDIAKRTTSLNKYPNLELRTIVSKDGISGTAARNALNQTPEKFTSFLPDELSDEEKQEVVSILSSSPINELLEQDNILSLKENINNPITVLSVIDPKRNLDEDQIIELFSENGKFYIYTNEEGEYENEREVDKHDARDYVDYYNARIKRDSSKEEKLGAKLKVLGIESELRFKLNSFSLNENVENIDYKKKIVELTKHMLDQGKNIKPLPKVVFKHDEQEAEDFFGKTAYYQPDTQTIVLYVKDRHPKDIVRSYSHEMIHHIQNLENRLGAVTTTDTNEDDNLDKIEREAYLDGNMTFRNWSDTYVGNQMKESIVGDKIECDKCGWSWKIVDGGDDLFICHKCGNDNTPINEKKNKDPFGLNAYAAELGRLREDYDDYKEFGKDIIIQSYMYFDEAYPLDPNKINLSDSIHFVSKLNDISRNKQRIKNVIFKQLMEAYRGTALESFNKKHNFTPEFGGFKGGGDSWDSPSAFFNFSPHFYKYENTTDSKGKTEKTITGFFSSQIEYASGIEAYDPNNDSIKKAAQQLGPLLNPMFDPSNLDNSPNNNSEVTPELDAILEVAPVTFIPFIEIPQVINGGDDELVTQSHQSKKVWKDIFNELGLICINYLKNPEWKMSNPQLDEKKDPFGLTSYARELALLREDEDKTNFKVYLDMDGVVADFDKRFKDLSGMEPKEFESKYGKNAFWDFIDEGDNKIKFWVGIEPMPNAQNLVSYINKNFDYEMLTAPSVKKQSRLGKSLWIRNWTNKGLFPSKPKINFKFSNNKQDFAAPKHILIDDKKRTIDQWNAAGGIGILYQSAEQVIKDLENVKKGI